MRLYHFLSKENALDDLKNNRIKISIINYLNDPSELLWLFSENAKEAEVLLEWKKDRSERIGMICFCQNWHNPLLWSHYAKRHEGICLGFDIADEFVRKVSYVDTRTPLNLPLSKEEEDRLLYTKFSGWKYEEESRVWLKLEEKDENNTGHYFCEFSEKIKLCEVIAGPLCDISKSEITKAIGNSGHDVQLVKAKIADDSFYIIKDERGFTG